MDLCKQTIQLKTYIDELKERFLKNEPPKSMDDKTFFLQMKEETAPIYDVLEYWEKETLSLIKNRQANVHPHQIVSTRENIELLILHSYYVDTRKKRYMELNHSSLFILDQLLRDLEK